MSEWPDIGQMVLPLSACRANCSYRGLCMLWTGAPPDKGPQPTRCECYYGYRSRAIGPAGDFLVSSRQVVRAAVAYSEQLSNSLDSITVVASVGMEHPVEPKPHCCCLLRATATSPSVLVHHTMSSCAITGVLHGQP